MTCNVSSGTLNSTNSTHLFISYIALCDAVYVSYNTVASTSLNCFKSNLTPLRNSSMGLFLDNSVQNFKDLSCWPVGLELIARQFERFDCHQNSRNSFRGLLKTHVFALYWSIQRIIGFTKMRYTNLLLTYLLTYLVVRPRLLSYLVSCSHSYLIIYRSLTQRINHLCRQKGQQ